MRFCPGACGSPFLGEFSFAARTNSSRRCFDTERTPRMICLKRWKSGVESNGSAFILSPLGCGASRSGTVADLARVQSRRSLRARRERARAAIVFFHHAVSVSGPLKDSGEVVISGQLLSLTKHNTFFRMPVNPALPRIPAQSPNNISLTRRPGVSAKSLTMACAAFSPPSPTHNADTSIALEVARSHSA